MAAERAFQVEEFLQRKREAMLNKVRAEGQLVRGSAFSALTPKRPSVQSAGAASAPAGLKQRPTVVLQIVNLHS